MRPLAYKILEVFPKSAVAVSRASNSFNMLKAIVIVQIQ